MNDFVSNLIRRGAGLSLPEDLRSSVLPERRRDNENSWTEIAEGRSASHENPAAPSFFESENPEGEKFEMENPGGAAEPAPRSAWPRSTLVRDPFVAPLHRPEEVDEPGESLIPQLNRRDPESFLETPGRENHRPQTSLPAGREPGDFELTREETVQERESGNRAHEELFRAVEEIALPKPDAKGESRFHQTRESTPPAVVAANQMEGKDSTAFPPKSASRDLEEPDFRVPGRSSQRSRPWIGAANAKRISEGAEAGHGSRELGNDVAVDVFARVEPVGLTGNRDVSSVETREVNTSTGPASIRVHIGRIEVRAAPRLQPPARGPLAGAAPTGLSLKEYLRQRNEGSR